MRNFYDPRTGSVHYEGTSIYVYFHERAHQAQHEENSLVFRVWNFSRWFKGLAYLGTLWIEVDAYRRARRRLRAIGLWSPEMQNEARQLLKTYLIKGEK
jgi:Zn-dependent membrane protease YugP